MKTIILRKRHQKMLEEAAALRGKIASFATRETDLAAQVEAATTDEELNAVAEAVAELETAQKSAKERLATIIEEADALLQEIEDAEAAAQAAAQAAAEPAAEEARSRRSSGASFQRRCQEFQRTGHMTYDDARSMVKRAAVTTAQSAGTTGVSGINDAAGNTVSGFIDLIKVTDATVRST